MDELIIIETARMHGLSINSSLTTDGEMIVASKEDFIKCVKDILEALHPTFPEDNIIGGM